MVHPGLLSGGPRRNKREVSPPIASMLFSIPFHVPVRNDVLGYTFLDSDLSFRSWSWSISASPFLELHHVVIPSRAASTLTKYYCLYWYNVCQYTKMNAFCAL